MDEFTMSATALYSEGRARKPFAEVSARTLVTCFGAMALEVSRWLAGALGRPADGARPRAIELTFSWSGPAAPEALPEAPEAPRNGSERADPPAGPQITRALRRGTGCSRSRRALRPARARMGALGARRAPAAA